MTPGWAGGGRSDRHKLHILLNQCFTPQRLFDPSSRCSANIPMQPVLRLLDQPNFLVVFEGCSREPTHCALVQLPETVLSGRYSPDLLTLGDLVGSSAALVSLDIFRRGEVGFRMRPWVATDAESQTSKGLTQGEHVGPRSSDVGGRTDALTRAVPFVALARIRMLPCRDTGPRPRARYEQELHAVYQRLFA